MNRYGAGLSSLPRALDAAAEAATRAAAGLDGAEPDLVWVFASAEHADDADVIAETVLRILGEAPLVGAVAADGVIGTAREVESGPAVSVWAASLDDAEVAPFALSAQGTAEGMLIAGWPEHAPLGADAVCLLLADPYTFPADQLLQGLGTEAPELAVAGGLAGGGAPGGARLLLGRDVLSQGAVGAVVAAPGLRVAVSQGCRPVGPELVVTSADGNAILELGGRPPMDRLRDLVGGLSAADRALAAQGLLAGLVVDENRPEYGVGDFLVRVILGRDEETDALIVGDVPRVGQTFRFHVRDASSAEAELRHLVAGLGRAGGALLFSCNGRGEGMFGQPDHDAGVVDELLRAPAAGLFCQGEIGPVGGRNYLHGFTATVVAFPD
jgi:small ligand-binding sensory domain FIST